MRATIDTVQHLLGEPMVRAGLRAAAIVLAGLITARLINRRLAVGPLRGDQKLLLRRIIAGVILGVCIAWALSELGLNVGVLLGAAGVLTVALGFAAQTAVSNLVSGLFLMVEQPFRIGDVIQVGDTTGEVIAVDLLSSKLRTFDNLYVRLPNETLIKTEFKNLTHFPIRRYDMQIGVAYKENLGVVRDVLFDIADANPLCLEEPKPLLIVLGFGESSVDLQFSAWAQREKFLDMRNSLFEQVKAAFDERGIEIPFPHRSLYTGSATAPIPVELVTRGGGDGQKMR